MQIAKKGAYLNSEGHVVDIRDALTRSMEGSVHYHHTHRFPEKGSTSSRQNILEAKDDTKFEVKVSSTMEAALALFEGEKNRGHGPSRHAHVGVLNSASGKLCGGRFREGTISQEDTICRAALLYPCLAQFENLENHYYRLNSVLPKGSSTTCAIFCPLVPVVRRDTVEASLLDTPQFASFVSTPAPNAFIISKQHDESNAGREDMTEDERKDASDEALREAVRDRIFRALSIFAEHGCTDLVLSAFGCGIHGNDPVVVATIFRDLLQVEFAGRFDRVIFAIHPSRYGNFAPFTSVFTDNSR
eukprot:CAMPEP_0113551390 /NCGR_PEP_ID=MMETSP0015_2-20120614/14499_1 /TAXON_ID=2838 /ORGANISM="Odontella" /LENGTH=301 /DNA_ID=CAMNT_0000452279 /DNA_START=224 /DNA_END=1129 /DNA_ORIENTATION=- /assembly_acc=CAM_ASM_000160